MRLAELIPLEGNPTCKYCRSTKTVKYGTRRGRQEYLCRACGRKYSSTITAAGMRTPHVVIGAAIGMFYDGLSLSAINRQLESQYGQSVERSTIWRWVIEYTKRTLRILNEAQPRVSTTWVADEAVVNVGGKKTWFWDVIDERTRYLLGTHLSVNRGMRDASALFRKISERVDVKPKTIITDGLNSYIMGIQGVFGYPKPIQHIKTTPFTPEINTNLIERFHGTLKQRTKVMRGLKGIGSARIILEGFTLHYNFMRHHMTFGDRTPAEVAGLRLEFRGWIGLVEKLGGARGR